MRDVSGHVDAEDADAKKKSHVALSFTSQQRLRGMMSLRGGNKDKSRDIKLSSGLETAGIRLMAGLPARLGLGPARWVRIHRLPSRCGEQTLGRGLWTP